MKRLLLLATLATDITMADEGRDLLTAADLADFENPPADARIHYGDDPLQFGDLRLPSGDGPHPVAIFIATTSGLYDRDRPAGQNFASIALAERISQ